MNGRKDDDYTSMEAHATWSRKNGKKRDTKGGSYALVNGSRDSTAIKAYTYTTYRNLLLLL